MPNDVRNHDGRYAPSPTGDLHLGNLRTALAAWLFARFHDARLVLRIDDLDPDRVRPGMAQRQLDDLAAIGIDWDGEPVVQTRRLALYEARLERLAATDATYPCFCTRADIRAAATAPHGDAPELAYPGTCARLDPRIAARRVAAGEAHCLRVRTDGVRTSVQDAFLGTVTCVVDDFVVRRKDGVPAYLLATTVDDHDLDIGLVVRGADLATSAPRQAWLAERLGHAPPRFAHVPLVLGSDGARLAKRHGAVTLRDLVALGRTPDDVRSQLAASLGLAEPTEAVSPAQLLDRFDPQVLPREPARFETL